MTSVIHVADRSRSGRRTHGAELRMRVIIAGAAAEARGRLQRRRNRLWPLSTVRPRASGRTDAERRRSLPDLWARDGTDALPCRRSLPIGWLTSSASSSGEGRRGRDLDGPGSPGVKQAISTIPIAMMAGDDPAALGLVASFARPGELPTVVSYHGTVWPGLKIATCSSSPRFSAALKSRSGGSRKGSRESRLRRHALRPGSPDDLRDWSLDLSPRLVPRAGGRRPRESRTPPPTAGSSAIRHPDPGSLVGIGCSGSGCHACGRIGASISSSFSPRRSSPGTATASSSTGAGGPQRTGWVARSLTPRFAT